MNKSRRPKLLANANEKRLQKFPHNSGNVDDEKDKESLNPNALPMLMKKEYKVSTQTPGTLMMKRRR